APAPLLPKRPRRRTRGDGVGRPVSACVPERDAASDRGRAAHLEGAPHGARRGEARRCAEDAWDRLELLRRVGGRGRAAEPGEEQPLKDRALELLTEGGERP